MRPSSGCAMWMRPRSRVFRGESRNSYGTDIPSKSQPCTGDHSGQMTSDARETACGQVRKPRRRVATRPSARGESQPAPSETAAGGGLRPCRRSSRARRRGWPRRAPGEQAGDVDRLSLPRTIRELGSHVGCRAPQARTDVAEGRAGSAQPPQLQAARSSIARADGPLVGDGVRGHEAEIPLGLRLAHHRRGVARDHVTGDCDHRSPYRCQRLGPAPFTSRKLFSSRGNARASSRSVASWKTT